MNANPIVPTQPSTAISLLSKLLSCSLITSKSFVHYRNIQLTSNFYLNNPLISSILTAVFLISSNRASIDFPRFDRNSTKIRCTLEHERKSFSISTLPMKPVPEGKDYDSKDMMIDCCNIF